MIAIDMPYRKNFLQLDDRRMASVDEGQGNRVVLLHGNHFLQEGSAAAIGRAVADRLATL